jgi:hypothetical protein
MVKGKPIYGQANKQPVQKVTFDGIDWRIQDVLRYCGTDYLANGIEQMCRIYCVQMIGRLKSLHHWIKLWWDCYFDNNTSKLTLHETEIHYSNKASPVKGNTCCDFNTASRSTVLSSAQNDSGSEQGMLRYKRYSELTYTKLFYTCLSYVYF